VPPPHYIKAPPWRRREHTISTSPPPRPPPTTSWCAVPCLSLSLSRVASGRAVWETRITTARRCRVAQFPDPCPKPSTSAARLETGFRESLWSPYVCEYAEVPLMWCRSHCWKIFTTLRSVTLSSSSSISVFKGTCPKHLPLQNY
jgi:hypothetical protein